MFSIIFALPLVVLVALALGTLIGVLVLERTNPPKGKFVDVAGGRLHYVELGPDKASGLPVVLLHGASSSLETMRQPLGDLLAKNHRVILFDRPGLGWSRRDNTAETTLASQADMIDEALGKIGIPRAIIVGHSLGGAVVPELALANPQRAAGLVMLSPVLYPWVGGVGAFNKLATVPVLGPLLAYTITLPLGSLMVEGGTRFVFDPQSPPKGYVENTQVRLVLRPRVFLNNAWDLAILKQSVTQRSPDYPKIKMPVTIITGDTDNTVSPTIHSAHFAQAVPQTKLIVLPGVGHMPQVVAAQRVVNEIELMMARTARTRAVVTN